MLVLAMLNSLVLLFSSNNITFTSIPNKLLCNYNVPNNILLLAQDISIYCFEFLHYDYDQAI